MATTAEQRSDGRSSTCSRGSAAAIVCMLLLALFALVLWQTGHAANDETCDRDGWCPEEDSRTERQTLTSSRPNFLILLADDLGYGDLASYGNPSQEWGGVDDLAAGGLRFSQAYSGDSMCSPSRAALLTGRLPIRTGVVGGRRVFVPSDTGGLPKEEITLPEILKTLGYRTGMVGKWHLGINENSSSDGAHLPGKHGFDFVGINLPMSMLWDCDETGLFAKRGPNGSWCFLYNDSRIVQQPINHTNLTQMLVDGFVRFLDGQKSPQPFFFYFSFPQVHTDLFAAPEFKGKSRRGLFGDNLNEMQAAVGKVMSELKRRQLDQNTLTVFLSDHGPHREICLAGGVTGGLFGGKGNSFEGGFRIPFITNWPGIISPGKLSSSVISALDLFPSFVSLAKGFLPIDRFYDGEAHVDDLLGRSVSIGPLTDDAPRTLFFYCNEKLLAVRFGAYKLHYYTVPVFQTLNRGNRTAKDFFCPNGWPLADFYVSQTCPDEDVIRQDPPLVFDLNDDPQEQYKLNMTEPICRLVETVNQRILEHKQTLFERRSPVLGKFNKSVIPCCDPPLCKCNKLLNG